jgi:hypothetical protein
MLCALQSPARATGSPEGSRPIMPIRQSRASKALLAVPFADPFIGMVESTRSRRRPRGRMATSAPLRRRSPPRPPETSPRNAPGRRRPLRSYATEATLPLAGKPDGALARFLQISLGLYSRKPP